jgi:L-asparaginase
MKVVPDYPKTCLKTLAFRRSLVVSLMSSVLMAVALLPAATVDAADLPTVAIGATGGTIAMKLDPQTNAPVPALSGEDLIAAVPKLKELANVRVVEFSNVPSDYMGPDLWPSLARKVDEVLADPGISGVIVSHGTDTLDQTAYFLDLAVTSDKPVVAVGAQRNASDWDTDGPRNLLNAVRQVISKDAGGRGVTITMNSYINAARDARKTHTSNVQTFTSGDMGYLGYVDEDRVVFSRAPLRRQHIDLPDRLPRVGLIAMAAGSDGNYVRYAADTGAAGIVIEAYGWGNLNEPMFEAIRYARDKGVMVVIATKVYNGRALPIYGFKGGGATTKKLGAVFADDLTPDKARVLTMLALPQSKTPEALQAVFDR